MANHSLKKFWEKLKLLYFVNLLREQDIKKFSNVIASSNYFYRHFAIYYGFPIRISDDGVFRDIDSSSVVKKLVFHTLFVLATLRALVTTFTLVVTLTFDRWYDPVFVPFHAHLAISFVACPIFGYLMLIKHPEELALVLKFNQERFGSVVTFGLRHLYLYAYPISAYLACLLLVIIFAFNAQYMAQFQWVVYWARVEGHLDGGGFLHTGLRVFAVGLDFWSTMTCYCFSCFVILTQTTFLEVWTATMKNLIVSKFNGNTADADQRALVEQLAVMLQIFNIGNAALIIVFKMTVLSLSIVGLSALILLDFKNALFVGAFLGWVAIMCPTCYPVIYYRGPQVAILLEEIKTDMLKSCASADFNGNVALFKRQLRSLSTKGVWVGPIRTFERESVLTFFDFVIAQVIDVVLTFGQG